MITEIDSARFEQEIYSSSVPVLVDFFTPECQPCIQMFPILEEIAQERSEALKVFKFNATKEPQFASRYRITSVPNFLLFQRGTPVAQRIGRVSKREMLEWLDAATSE